MIRAATMADVIEYFSERDLPVPDSINANAIVVDESLLFIWSDMSADYAEAHICCRRSKAKIAHRLVNSALWYLRLNGYKAVMTTAGLQYTAAHKLAMRLGFVHLGCYNESNIYARTLQWA